MYSAVSTVVPVNYKSVGYHEAGKVVAIQSHITLHAHYFQEAATGMLMVKQLKYIQGQQINEQYNQGC